MRTRLLICALVALLLGVLFAPSLQAQHGEIEITAGKDITLTACKGKVTMAAQEEILLTSGGGYIRIKGGNIEIHCPEVVSMKAASHQWLGPDAMYVPMPRFGESVAKDCLAAAAERREGLVR